MSKIFSIVQQAAAAASPPPTGDSYFSDVSLLLSGNGTNGDNNNTFTDSSTNGFTVTKTGDVVQGSFSPYGNNWSVYFDDSTSNQYLQVADSSTFDATTSLCIEAWFYMTSAPGSGANAHAIVNKWVSTTPGQRTIFIDVEDTGLRVYADLQGASNPVLITTDGGAISQNEWHHVAVTWDGSTYRAFLDGVLEGSTTSSSAPVASSQPVRVGYNTNTHYFGGYISNVRWVTNGGAIYTSNFTPPTEPLTAISGTALLLNSSNGFKDESTNNHTVTVNGDPEVTPFSPFKNDDARTLSTDGGSGYFDGSGDYLSASSSVFSSPASTWTIEAWAYWDGGSKTGFHGVVGSWPTEGYSSNNSFVMENVSGTMMFYYIYGSSSGNGISMGTFNAHEWNHFKVIKTATHYFAYKNGVQQSSTTLGANFKGTTNNVTVGGYITGATAYWPGYIADVRIQSGGTSGNFTPPTSPLESSGTTYFHTGFQDAGIYDYTGINNVDTVGNAQIDTSTKKYGTGSIEFDGSGDYLKLGPDTDLEIGTGDFTIEGWIYTNTTDYKGVFQFANSHLPGSIIGPALFWQPSTNLWRVYSSADSYHDVTETINVNTWYHFALVRDSGVYELFVNGVSKMSFTNAHNINYSHLVIGGNYSASYLMDGHIDDFRVTKGVARYTSTFTPPSAALPKF
jgi:hypothetical protein